MRKYFLLKLWAAIVLLKIIFVKFDKGFLETPLVSAWRNMDENQICRKNPIETNSIPSVC